MKRYHFVLIAIALLMWGLACGTLGGASPTEPAPTVNTVSTPTLAPTTTTQASVLETAAALAGGPTPVSTILGIMPGQPTTVPGSGTDGESSGGSSSSGGGDGSNSNGSDSGGSGSDGSGSAGGDGGGSTTAAGCPAGGQNILVNPSFEGQFVPYGAFAELNHAPPWIPWWRDGESNQRPEFKPAEAALAPNRVHSGSTAQQYFKSFGMFKAGMQQSVLNVPVGSRLQLSAHGQAWSCEEFDLCKDGSSVNPANMFMRVGIDPKGGTDPFSNAITWSAYFNPLDQWQVACVEEIAEAEVVTVFLWSSPDGPRQNQDVYWDDASLVVLP